MLEQVQEEVKSLMIGNNDGHGFDHVERVFRQALKFAKMEGADQEIVGLAALLHDVDDYKLVGAEAADKLLNAKAIMATCKVAEEKATQVCDIISHMGYSKSLKGIRPSSLEGKCVSDADMLDAIGAWGVIRTLAYALERCHGCADKIFAEDVWPELNLTAEQYRRPNRKSDNFVNHFFEKLFRLKDLMMTQSGAKEAEIRHEFMYRFLEEMFRESNNEQWLAYLRDYAKEDIKKSCI